LVSIETGIFNDYLYPLQHLVAIM